MLRIRQIQTTTNAKGETVPALDAEGREIELVSIEVPRRVEAKGPAAIDAYVAAQLDALTAPTPPDPAAVDVVDASPIDASSDEPAGDFTTIDDEEPTE